MLSRAALSVVVSIAFGGAAQSKRTEDTHFLSLTGLRGAVLVTPGRMAGWTQCHSLALGSMHWSWDSWLRWWLGHKDKSKVAVQVRLASSLLRGVQYPLDRHFQSGCVCFLKFLPG